MPEERVVTEWARSTAESKTQSLRIGSAVIMTRDFAQRADVRNDTSNARGDLPVLR
jgi:hypothetical protein